jgi:hypothetical protein
MVRSLLARTFAALTLTASIGCSSSSKESTVTPTRTDGGAAASSDAGASKVRPKTAPKTPALRAIGGAKPPAGAKQTGTATQPKVGSLTVPIEAATVYVVMIDFDQDGKDDQVNWARGTDATYLWVTGPMECGDGATDPNGAFMMEVKDDGTGTWLFSLDACPTSNLFGCDFDETGAETTCGVCVASGDGIACAVSP